MREYFYRGLGPPYRTVGPFPEESGPADLIKGDHNVEKNDTTLAIGKTSPAYVLIQKCLSGNLEGVTKQDIDVALDALATQLATEQGISHDEAYSAVLTGPDGATLYSARESAPVGDVGKSSPLQKDEVSKAQHERDAELLAGFGMSLAESRQHVREYYASQKN